MTNNPYDFIICPTDTDSISFCKSDMSPFSKQEIDSLINEINEISPEYMIWDNDGYYEKCLVLKAKNYVLMEEGKPLKIRGSSIRDNKREKKLLEFINKIIDLLLEDRRNHLLELYNDYIKQCFNIKDMTLWSKKITVTESVLNPKRTNEQKVLDAIGEKPVQEGDKLYVFFRKDESLCLLENFNGEYDEMVLIQKVYKTLCIFENVINIDLFPKYHLKKNKKSLEELLKNEDSI